MKILKMGDCVEMDAIKISESKLLNEGNNNESNRTSIEIEQNCKIDETKSCQSENLEEKFYQIIFSILTPYIFIGCPLNFCFGKKHKGTRQFTTSLAMKVYTCSISVFAHSILLFWIGRLALHMFTLKHLNEELMKDLFMLSYIVAGVVALDIIWLNRQSIMEVLSDLLDYWPLPDSAKYRSLFTQNILTLKCYRLKFSILRILSLVLVALLLVYYCFLAFSVIEAYTDTDPEGYTEWRERITEIISIYSLFFFSSNAILLLSFVWATQYKIKHLNLFICNLVRNNEHPLVEDVEMVKNWYQNILKTTKNIDNVFGFYIIVYIGFFFVGIIYFVSRILDLLSADKIENLQLMALIGLAFLMMLFLFYGLKELSDVNEYSRSTKSILYNYVLNTKPEERSTKFFEEVNFVTVGLLDKAASFTIMGQIELTKSFIAHLVVIIYSYAVIFHQFAQKISK